MPPGIGYKFQPGLDDDTQMGGNGDDGRGGPRQSPQGPVRILSLRIPKQPSITGIAPHALLTSPGGAAPGAQGLDSLIAALIQAFRPQAAAGGAVSGVPTLPPALAQPPPQLPTFGPSPQPSVDQDYLSRAAASTPESRARKAAEDARRKSEREFTPRITFDQPLAPAPNPSEELPGLF